MIGQHKEKLREGAANPSSAPGRDDGDEPNDGRCRSGSRCPAFAETGAAQKLAAANKDDFCYRCRTRLAEETTKNLDARRRGTSSAAAARRIREEGSVDG